MRTARFAAFCVYPPSQFDEGLRQVDAIDQFLPLLGLRLPDDDFALPVLLLVALQGAGLREWLVLSFLSVRKALRLALTARQVSTVHHLSARRPGRPQDSPLSDSEDHVGEIGDGRGRLVRVNNRHGVLVLLPIRFAKLPTRHLLMSKGGGAMVEICTG